MDSISGASGYSPRADVASGEASGLASSQQTGNSGNKIPRIETGRAGEDKTLVKRGADRVPPSQGDALHQNDMRFIQTEIVEKVAVHWRDLGLDLGIEDYVLDRIKKDNPINPEKCCKLMFNELCNKGNVTYQKVIESLYELQFRILRR